MKAYLLLDFGSTYTKLTCVDVEAEEIVAREKVITTVQTGLMDGFYQGLEKIKEKLPRDIKFEKTLACSSAAGGLKMVAVGLAKDLTAEAAKRAALGAGARILKTYSLELSDEDIEEMESLNCDIILLSGGTENGNKVYISHNARKLTQLKREIPIVVAGNSAVNEEIARLFDENKMDYVITENVMPKVNTLNAEPARECIRKIFMEKIALARGINTIEGFIDGVIMPTPGAVLKGAELLSLGTETEEGLGDLMVVDVGGATTDIHSVGKGSSIEENVRFEGLQEPFAKRTVEGDLGMRYSALSLYESVGEEKIKANLDEDYDIKGECIRRSQDIMMVPKTPSEFKFDEALAKCAVEFATDRHVGHMRKEYSYTRYIYYQSGKDLRDLKTVIGTGGVIVHSKTPENILSCTNYNEDRPYTLSPENPNYYVDIEYILSAMGILGTVRPDEAIRIMKKYLKKVG
ncbi:methylaspartate mutase accessory protein GlmL [Anaerosphaera multitolerans]|uniref:MutL protein n=1 Tax=Anaerosphaera multitolerans TaxID=2487351 RepID=A0A437S9D7_9FIRM|nr:methylaspartate mutase accessory protein GlmL [Anaerosphaera multitolerans]RVU55511.1 MutL protein [Anaerosphaera multitolerans]